MKRMSRNYPHQPLSPPSSAPWMVNKSKIYEDVVFGYNLYLCLSKTDNLLENTLALVD